MPENAFFYFSAFLFFGRKRHPHFRFFFFSVLKWQYKTRKEGQYFGWCNVCYGGQNSWVTCSRIQPLSTSPPAVHEYCEAVSTELVSIAPPARKFLSAPPTSAASEQLFSAAGQIYSDRRSSLLVENAEKLLFLAYNIRLFDFKYWSLHAELMLPNDTCKKLNSLKQCLTATRPASHLSLIHISEPTRPY